MMKIEELMEEPHTPLPATGAKITLKDEDSPDEKTIIPFQAGGHQHTPLPVALPIVEKKVEDISSESFSSSGFLGKDAKMARVEREKRMALIKAWEDNEKAKAENRAYKQITVVESWEERKKALLELQQKKIEEKLEKAKAAYQEQKKNKVAELHKIADEKRAAIEAQCGRHIVEIVGKADRYRTTGRVPKKIARCFSSISC